MSRISTAVRNRRDTAKTRRAVIPRDRQRSHQGRPRGAHGDGAGPGPAAALNRIAGPSHGSAQVSGLRAIRTDRKKISFRNM